MANNPEAIQKYGKRGRPQSRTRHRLSVEIDPDVRDQVKALARRERTSLAEQIRCCIEWGLEAAGAEEDEL